MATIVGAFGVPHMPTSPGDCAANPESLTARAFAAVREHVDEIDPDVLVVFDTDHFHHWFYDRLPAFAVGVASSTDGPGTDDWPGEARFDAIPVDEDLASHVYASGLSVAFDLTPQPGVPGRSLHHGASALPRRERRRRRTAHRAGVDQRDRTAASACVAVS